MPEMAHHVLVILLPPRTVQLGPCANWFTWRTPTDSYTPRSNRSIAEAVPFAPDYLSRSNVGTTHSNWKTTRWWIQRADLWWSLARLANFLKVWIKQQQKHAEIRCAQTNRCARIDSLRSCAGRNRTCWIKSIERLTMGSLSQLYDVVVIQEASTAVKGRRGGEPAHPLLPSCNKHLSICYCTYAD